MKKNNFMKVLVLSMSLLLCSGVFAQQKSHKGGGALGLQPWFGEESFGLMNRGDRSVDQEDDEFAFEGLQHENPTPVGSGLLIMVAAGAGYALLKKKEEEK